MATGIFNGTLNSNEIFAALYNMIISQTVFADSIGNTKYSLVDKFRVDGSMYGDTKLYYASDILSSYEWGNYAEASNLLDVSKPEPPKCQKVTLDKFRQITITVDNYLSKRAWSTEGAFSTFHSVILARIRQTKNVYDETLMNVFLGTNEVSTDYEGAPMTSEKVMIELPTDNNAEAQNRLQGQKIAEDLANLIAKMADLSRDYNQYHFLRNYDPSELMILWNVEARNKILKIDLPTIFHKDGLFESLEQHNLPARYFGKIVEQDGTADGETHRSMVEKDFNDVHCFPGDLLPEGATFSAKEVYQPDETILFKVVHKDAVPYMSAFETATSFFNPRSLTENHYLTWGFSEPCNLYNFPFITVRGE